MIKKKVLMLLAGAVVLGSVAGGTGEIAYASDFVNNSSLIEAKANLELGSMAINTLESSGWVKKDNVVTSPDKSMKFKSCNGVDGIDSELTITVASADEDILDVVRMMTGAESEYTAEELTQFIHNGTCVVDDGLRMMKVQYNGKISFECVITFFSYGYSPTADQLRIQLEFDDSVEDEAKPPVNNPSEGGQVQPPVVEKPSEDEEVKPPVSAPSEGEETPVEPPVVEKPSEDEEVKPPVSAPSEGEETPVEPPVVEKPSEDEEVKPPVSAPSEGEETPVEPPVVEKPSEDEEAKPPVNDSSQDEVPSVDNNKVVIENILQGLDKDSIIISDGDGSKKNPYKIEFKVYNKEKIQSIIDMGEVVSKEEVDGYTIVNIRIQNKSRERMDSDNYTNIEIKFKSKSLEEIIIGNQEESTVEIKEEILVDREMQNESLVVKTSDGVTAVPLITTMLSLIGVISTRRKK